MIKIKKNKKQMLSSFSIILLLIIALGVITQFLPQAQYIDGTIVNGSGVEPASLPTILMSPILGFENAVDVCIFVLVLGGFLAIVNRTGAFKKGIKVLISKLKGNEIILIPILMLIFSIGGTTYGMLEETVVFYAILAATMVTAGMDTLVASAIVLLGAGSGVLGSTINPFAVGAAISSLPEGIEVNQGIIIALGAVLWITTLLISIAFVVSYAKKVIKDKGSTFLSIQEQEDMEDEFGEKASSVNAAKLSVRQKLTLIVFALSFLVMIVGFIPWTDFGVTIFDGWTSVLTGSPFGLWWFYDAAVWFLIAAIILAIINGFSETIFVKTFLKGATDMIGVILIIAVARGVSVLMEATYLDNYFIYNAAEALKNVSGVVFAPLNYLLHIGLSVLVPSSSGLASISTPIMAPLAQQLGYNTETTIMTFVAANGLVNLFTPTCGAIMGGLALAKVQYTTWLKWVLKIIVVIALVNIIILTVASIIL